MAVHTWRGSYRRASVNTPDSFTLSLGDLRELMTRTKDMSDKAMILTESLSKSSTDGEYYVKTLMVREESVD